MKSFAALSAAVGLASIAGRASAFNTFTSSSITDKFNDVVHSNGLLGLKNVNVMLYENDFKGILGSYNGTFPINAAVALHFMGFLGGNLPISLFTCIHFKKGYISTKVIESRFQNAQVNELQYTSFFLLTGSPWRAL